jgi:hypothetical protein
MTMREGELKLKQTSPRWLSAISSVIVLGVFFYGLLSGRLSDADSAKIRAWTQARKSGMKLLKGNDRASLLKALDKFHQAESSGQGLADESFVNGARIMEAATLERLGQRQDAAKICKDFLQKQSGETEGFVDEVENRLNAMLCLEKIAKSEGDQAGAARWENDWHEFANRTREVLQQNGHLPEDYDGRHQQYL